MDNTSIHPLCAAQVHQVDLHLWRGPPINTDPDLPIQILVNQGYVVGFCPGRLQPAWSAYRVAWAEQDVDFDRPLHYHDDLRLPAELRIGRKTFGKLGNIRLDVGHMAPNEVINRQFGRLAQMETFLMSNMSPQYGSLNSGVWLKLENAIREIKDEEGKDHVWAIVGPVFGDQPASVNRGNGKYVPVPEAYFGIMVDPKVYPYDRISGTQIDCFIIPQDAPPSSNPMDYPATLADIERRTRLKFFPDWGRDVPVAMVQAADDQAAEAPAGKSRLVLALEQQKSESRMEQAAVAVAQPDAATIPGLIASLKAEADALQAVQRPLSDWESARLVTLQHTITWLMAAQRIAAPVPDAKRQVELITYKLVNDMDGRLKDAARLACNFWNRFLAPGYSVVIRLGIFTASSNTIARAYKPFQNDGVHYGVVEFNTKYLAQFSTNDTAGTIIHEIGHVLGIGWDTWNSLFERKEGRFLPHAIAKVPALAEMRIELRGLAGTIYAHWDEQIFDAELMTGYKDAGEYVLPVTLAVMELLGHKVVEQLPQARPLNDLLAEVANLVFSMQDEVRTIDLEHFEPTELAETVPHLPA